MQLQKSDKVNHVFPIPINYLHFVIQNDLHACMHMNVSRHEIGTAKTKSQPNSNKLTKVNSSHKFRIAAGSKTLLHM